MQIYVIFVAVSGIVTFSACASIDQSGTSLTEVSRVKRHTLLDEFDDESRPASLFNLLLSRMAEASPKETYLDAMAEVKRSSTGEIIPDALPLTRKRKVFWQPLGYLPASARIGNHNGATGNAKDKTGSNIFRYGK